MFFYKHYVYKRIQAQVWKWFFIDKPSLYFLCSFYWYFSKIFWWFYFNEIYNCCVFASLPVYHFGWNLTAVYYVGWNLTASLFIPSSPSIWNSRVHCIKTCSQWRVFLCFSVTEPNKNMPGQWNIQNQKTLKRLYLNQFYLVKVSVKISQIIIQTYPEPYQTSR